MIARLINKRIGCGCRRGSQLGGGHVRDCVIITRRRQQQQDDELAVAGDVDESFRW